MYNSLVRNFCARPFMPSLREEYIRVFMLSIIVMLLLYTYLSSIIIMLHAIHIIYFICTHIKSFHELVNHLLITQCNIVFCCK